jgi:hypothetical protein
MLNPQKFFTDLFPNCYICAMADGGGQFEGYLVDKDTDLNKIISTFQLLNKDGYNIFFTPNAGKTVEGRNSLTNLAQVNSWWIDIDINETKKCENEEDMILRNTRKAQILGKIFECPLIPSLTIETRNGFQLYWNAVDGTAEKWLEIGMRIYSFFREIGADKSTVKPMQLMRVPMFWYFKHSEVGKIKISESFSSLKKYTEKEMMESFPEVLNIQLVEPLKEKVVWKTKYKATEDDKDVFVRISKLPIDEVISKISGHWLVNGEQISLSNDNEEKAAVLINGKSSPNWVNRRENKIFSNNAERRGPNIIAYLSWYQGKDWKKMAEGLKELFK